jgi:hypothetical protein
MSVLANLANPAVPLSSPAESPPAAPPSPRTWLFSPTFDLLFVANLAWPLVMVLGFVLAYLLPRSAETGLGVASWSDPLTIFQFYILSTAHRWATPFLVFMDREHFWKKPIKFGGIGLALIGLGLLLIPLGSVYANLLPAGSLYPGLPTGLLLLGMVDYFWNAWHFAAQHAGISRIYGRRVRPELSQRGAEFEKMALRLLALWFFLRLAIALLVVHSPFVKDTELAAVLGYVGWLDPLFAAPAVWLLITEIRAYRAGCQGRLAYIASVVVHYSSLLALLELRSPGWLEAAFLANAIFHATEYLAIVSWSVQKKSAGVWAYLVPRWGLTLVGFCVALGAASMLVAAHSIYAWALITYLVSYLHYAYDGIIWKAPRPAPKPIVA